MYRRGIPATTGHPPGMPSPRRVPLPAFALILAFAVLLGMLLYYAQFSGTIRWLLGVVALAVLAAIAWGQIHRRTSEPSPVVGPRSPGPTRPRPRGLRPRVPRRPHADGGVAVNIASVREVGSDLLDAVETVIVGKRPVLERVLWAILGDGHLLIEDVPGLAKTLIAKSFAAGLGLSFRRIQFTPDLLPADITGTYVFDRKTGEFVLRRGPVFTNVLLADEINRAPPKTQSALLEAMQERQATLEGETFPLDRPFFVIATQNPIEHEATYPLPEAQVDRFLLKIDVGYPTREQEIEILQRRRNRRSDDAPIEPV